MSELLLLKLRNAIADKEFCIAAGNRELAQYGQWSSDWHTGYIEASREVVTILRDLGGTDAMDK